MKVAPGFSPEMQSILVQELAVNGVDLGQFPWMSSETVVREIATSVVAQAHEGRTAPFGVIYADDVTALIGVERVAMPLEQLNLSRHLASGTHCFLLFDKDRFYGLAHFKEPVITELQLVRILPASGGMVVQRGPGGVTKFFQGDSIVIHENRVWFTKPHVKEAAWKVSQCVNGVNRTVLNRILEFSFHRLSPTSRVGGTFVWCLYESEQSILKALPEGDDLTMFNLSIMDEAHSETICHLLSQVDGATFLDPVGRLVRTGVQLKYSELSKKLVPELRGTRHTSAQRYSFDIESALVITISEDGPVTVFSDGANVADLQIHSSFREARILKEAIPEKREDISSRSFELLCPHCGKTAMLEQIDVRGLKSEKRMNCPVCHGLLHTASCYTLEGRPFKKLPGPPPTL